MSKKSRKKSHSKIITHKIEGIPITFFDPRYKTLVKEELKNQFGIYALYKVSKNKVSKKRKERLYYVGIAQHNIANRIKQHKRNNHKGRWNYFSVYFTKKKDFLKILEDAFISVVLPKGNIQKPKKIFKDNKRIMRKMEQIDKEKRMPMSRSVRSKKINALKQKNHKKKTSRKKSVKKDSSNVILKDRFQTSILLEKLDKRNDKIYRAKLLKSGQIKYEGKIYDSPSAAAKAATRLEKNGWTFWHFKHGDQWVALDSLRKKAV